LPENEEDLMREVERLKRELGAVILAHNYQSPEVQDVADFVGDSLELSLKAAEVGAKFIVFCGVDFMAEQAAVITESSVLHPDPAAKCPMASMISVDDILRARREHRGAPVVIYVNSPASVKAEADYVVTSANAVDLVKALEEDTVIFGPDRHLADYVAERTGKNVIPVPEHGHCPVHVKFNPTTIRLLKSIYRGYAFLAHPECPREVRELADFIGSTSQILRYFKSSRDCKFIIGTEIGIIYRMLREREASLIPASTEAFCEDMKRITLEKVHASLKQRVYRVEVSKEVAAKVRRALENTFKLLGVEVPWSRI